VQEYYRARILKALREIETTRVTEGVRIWKLYNHGFLVRTPSATFTFDIVPGVVRVPGFTVGEDTLKRIVAQSDALFISHEHGDHANRSVATMFLEEDKPVLAPEGLWANEPIGSRLTYPARSTSTVHNVPVKSGKVTLKVVAYPGHQGGNTGAGITNNVHLVETPEGSTVMQTGDQSNSKDFEWIDRVGAQRKVDILLPNCWSTDIKRLAAGVNPQLIITGHENEMGHTVDHREDYSQTYQHLFGTKYPLLVMTWGETYAYKP
jgi:L-ascorbate metabolism protein UlaG (beta-lactamase superfamily)